MAYENKSGGRIHRTSRRVFLKQSLAFSVLHALYPKEFFADEHQDASPPNANNKHILLLGDWGTHSYPKQQLAVAQSMQAWVERYKLHPESMILLGDNWYGRLPGGVKSSRWQTQFEQMYPTSHFPGPMYAVLGNHDYERLGANKVQAQLDYPKSTTTRWTMPSRWYSFKFPENDPLIKFICLDSNLPGTKGFDLLPWSFLMSKQDRDEQNEWLRAELAKPREAEYLVVIAHHPLYTNGMHKDNPLLIAQWDKLLREHKVDFYITGHDHDLQHLEFEGHPTSFVISGGGGAELVSWSRPPESRGPWGKRALGFTDMEITKDKIIIRHIGVNAQQLYAFQKDKDRKVGPVS